MDQSDVPIAYKECSPPASPGFINAPIILLHGITYAKETWDESAQEIADRTMSKVYSLDSRNHGDSGWAETINYNVMAEDVARFMDAHDIPRVTIVGHSMGGKTGMSFAFKYAEKLESLILEDISTRNVTGSESGVSYYMQQLKDVVRKIPRGTKLTEAKRFAASYLVRGEAVTKNFVTKMWDGRDLPLKQTSSGGYEWKTNLDVVVDARQSGKWTPLSSVGIYEGPVLLIYGTKSPFKVLDDKVEFLKQFPKTQYRPIQDGGHSLHIEYPEIFTNLVSDFILKQRASSARDKCMISSI